MAQGKGKSPVFGGGALFDPLLIGLVAFWKFDEITGSTGIAIDEIGYNDGTVTGATRGVTGHNGTAYSFTGTNRVVIPNNTDLALTTNWSIAFWINLDNQPGTKYILSNGAYNIYTGADKKLNLEFYKDGYGFMYWTSANALTGWTHVVIAGDGTDVKIYLNKLLQLTGISPFTQFRTPVSDLYLGSWYADTSYTFIGFLDDIGIWKDVTLDQIKVNNLYDNGIMFPTRFTSSKIVNFSSIQGATVYNFRLDYNIDNGGKIRIDWGNGNTSRLTADGNDQTINSGYSTINTTYPIRIYGEIEKLNLFYIRDGDLLSAHTVSLTITEVIKFIGLEILRVNYAKMTGSITNNLPSTLTELRLYHLDSDNDGSAMGSDVISINIDNLPAGLTDLQIEYCAINGSGSVNNIPTGVTGLAIDGAGSDYTADLGNNFGSASMTGIYLIGCGSGIVGNLNNMFARLTSLETLVIFDTGTLTGSINNASATIRIIAFDNIGTSMTGNVETLHTDCTYISFSNCGTGITYGGGAVPAWASATIIKIQTTMSSTISDNLLIGWASTVTGTTPCTMTLQNARTSASDAAVTDLTNNHAKTIITAN